MSDSELVPVPVPQLIATPKTFKAPKKNLFNNDKTKFVYNSAELANFYTAINHYSEDNTNFFYNYNNEVIKPAILDRYNNFNIDYIDEYVFKMSQNSVNGIIYKSVYKNEVDQRKFFVAIKCSMKKNTDNNYYEYRVGQCINKIKEYFPNFIYTFNYNFIDNNLLNNYYNKSTNFFDKDTINNDLIDANKCKFNDKAASIIEFIPNIISLDDIIDALNPKELESEVYNILFQLYMALHTLKDDFTHYDLHIDNVQFTKVPDNKKIVLTYYYDNNKYKIVTSYIPIIIDYGKSYINCAKFGLDIKTNEFIEKMCNIPDCNHPDDDAYYNCDLTNSGIYYVGDKDDLTNKLDPNVTKINVSQDLRYIYMLLSDGAIIEKLIKSNFLADFHLYKNTTFFTKKTSYYNVDEHTDNFKHTFIQKLVTTGTINTLTDCVKFLLSYYSSFYNSFYSSSYNLLSYLFNRKKSDADIYGYMNIYCDNLIKFRFVNEQDYVDKTGNNYDNFIKSIQDYKDIEEQKEDIYDGIEKLWMQKYLKYKHKYMKLKKLKKLYK
jgi:hypothetical protein